MSGQKMLLTTKLALLSLTLIGAAQAQQIV